MKEPGRWQTRDTGNRWNGARSLTQKSAAPGHWLKINPRAEPGVRCTDGLDSKRQMRNLEAIRWDCEVETVRDQLVRAGVPEWPAMEKAVDIVSKRRRAAAKLDELPDDVRRAIAGL